MRRSIYYIGAFPEPFGGATIKNEILFNELNKHFNISKYDTSLLVKGNKYIEFLRLVIFLVKNRNKYGVICIASNSLFRLSNLVYKINKQILNKNVVFVIGGIMPKLLAEQNQKIEVYKEYKKIYVETGRMKDDLNELGLENVEVIPNVRVRPNSREYITSEKQGLKCVFFSRISSEKGINKIINVFNNIKLDIGITVDFYGPIDNQIKEEFKNNIEGNSRMDYKGVFDSVNQDVYKVLSKYDILLFPTEHKGEGFPGILAEAKIAGLPIIASDINYNSEIVNDGIDGIILKKNTEGELLNSLNIVNKDRDYLNGLRKASFQSADKYFIDDYVYLITREMGVES